MKYNYTKAEVILRELDPNKIIYKKVFLKLHNKDYPVFCAVKRIFERQIELHEDKSEIDFYKIMVVVIESVRMALQEEAAKPLLSYSYSHYTNDHLLRAEMNILYKKLTEFKGEEEAGLAIDAIREIIYEA